MIMIWKYALSGLLTFLLPLLIFAQTYQTEVAGGKSSDEGYGNTPGYRPVLKTVGKQGLQLTLARNGKTDYQIVLPDSFGNDGIKAEVWKCADIMRKAFLESAGVEIQVVPESQMNANKPAIFIGNTRHTENAGIQARHFYGMDCIMASDGRNVYLAGNDRHTALKKEPARLYHYFYIIGSVRAMILFMDQYMGVRFLLPGETGIEYPECDTILIPASLNEFRPQPWEYALGGTQNNYLYDCAANKYGHSTFLMQGGHSYNSAVPLDKYKKTHPEYFNLRGGKRDLSINHLCISNPDVQRLNYEFLKNILTNVRDRRNGTELGQYDGFIPCECKPCAAYGNTRDWGEKLWIFHRNLAEKLQKEVPGKKLVIISYGPTANPPKSFHSFPDNVIIELCNYTPDDFEKWKNISVPGGFAVYVYWGPYYEPGITPSKTPRSLWKDAKLFRDNHVKGIMHDGSITSFGLEGASYYVFSKLQDHPNADYQKLADEYYAGMFPDSTREMRDFFTLLYSRVDAFPTLKKEGELSDNPRPLLSYIYTPDLLSRLEYLLGSAEKKAVSEKEKRRLVLVRKEFDYVKKTGTVVQLYNAYLLRPCDMTFQMLAEAIEDRNAYINTLFTPDGKKKPIPGWPEMEIFWRKDRKIIQLNGMFAAQMETPLGWNVKHMLKNEVRPNTDSVRNALAVPVHGKIFESDFESGAWKNAKWQKLMGYQGGTTSRQTRFKVLYDGKNLYLGIESELDQKKTFVAQGPDNGPGGQDFIEIMIDPFGARKQHYHLVYSPIENSRFDRAYGLIQDTLDPRYGQPDPSWTGAWTYATTRKEGKWYSMVTIPYSVLKAAKPDFTSLWTLNVGRTIRHPGKESEYTLWSPQMGKFDFSDRNSFGELHFAKE